MKNSQIDHGGVGRHELRGWLHRWTQRGTRFVNVSPIAKGSLKPVWMPIRPGTDTALMLALIHTLITDGSYDRDFLERYCTGWDALASYITGAADGTAKDADWASRITTVDPTKIRALARSLVEQRSHHGEHVIWTAIALAAAIGQIGRLGGGFGIGSGKSLLPFLDRGTLPGVQGVVATLPCWRECRCSLRASAGVFQLSVLRGRLLSAAATASRSSRECLWRSVRLGKYWRRRPLVFSLVPRCHGLWGSQK